MKIEEMDPNVLVQKPTQQLTRKQQWGCKRYRHSKIPTKNPKDTIERNANARMRCETETRTESGNLSIGPIHRRHPHIDTGSRGVRKPWIRSPERRRRMAEAIWTSNRSLLLWRGVRVSLGERWDLRLSS